MNITHGKKMKKRAYYNQVILWSLQSFLQWPFVMLASFFSAALVYPNQVVLWRSLAWLSPPTKKKKKCTTYTIIRSNYGKKKSQKGQRESIFELKQENPVYKTSKVDIFKFSFFPNSGPRPFLFLFLDKTQRGERAVLTA